MSSFFGFIFLKECLLTRVRRLPDGIETTKNCFYYSFIPPHRGVGNFPRKGEIRPIVSYSLPLLIIKLLFYFYPSPMERGETRVVNYPHLRWGEPEFVDCSKGGLN
jgi:hypothetical protein